MGITREQALDCFASDDLIGMGMEADAVRRRLHPEGVATYTIEHSIHLTGENGLGQVGDVEDSGATSLIMPDLPGGTTLAHLESALAGLRQRFPRMTMGGLTAEDVLLLAKHSDVDLRTAIARLRDAGLGSISGDRAAILDDTVRAAHGQCSAADWLSVHRTAHKLGISTSASMTFGGGETPEQRVRHLEALGQLQEETAGFAAFTLWSYQPASKMTSDGREEPTAVEYLKTLAISRMYLDNIEHVESSAAIQGLKVLQMCLRFGADDAGAVTHLEANAPSNEEELRRIIRDAGFRPVQRDASYCTMYLD